MQPHPGAEQHVLQFGHDPNHNYLPAPDAAAAAAAWAGRELGHYRLAQALMSVAAALEEIRDHTAMRHTAYATSNARIVPLLRPPVRNDVPAAADRPISHAPQRCTATVRDGAALCGALVRWAARVGDVPPGWYHLDPEITDHEPEGPA